MFLSTLGNLRIVPASTPILDLIRRLQARRVLDLLARPAVRICALVVNGANADINRFRRDLAQARSIWGPCGIDIIEGGFSTINADLDYPNWTDLPQAPQALVSQRGTCTADSIRAFYVRSIAGSQFQGRTGVVGSDPGYIALSDQAHPNLFPHELGHVFLGGNEQHRDTASPADRVNIMRSDVGTIEGPPQVDADQCRRAVERVRARQVPAGTQLAVPTSFAAFGASQMATVRALLAGTDQSLEALAGMGQAVLPHLTAFVTTDSAPTIRARAAAMLGRIGGDQAIQGLVRAAIDTDPGVRLSAIAALGQLAALPHR